MSELVKERTYVNIFVALMVFTVATVGASRIELGGSGNVLLGLAIAVVKATLVGLFFMHLKFERGWVLVFVFFPLILFTVFVCALMPDIAFGAAAEAAAAMPPAGHAPH